MKVLITGGAGFLGQELCKSLLRPGDAGLRRCKTDGDEVVKGDPEVVKEIVLFDMPGSFDAIASSPACSDARVRCLTGHIEDAAAVRGIIDTLGMSVFHLAGIMSGQGEKDFDLAMRVNFDGTRHVLDACRAQAGGRLIRVVFASSGATFGETADCPVSDTTKQVPLNTYGMTKTVGEMLVNDYTRRGFLDGCSARLPTVVVRPGKPNAASTSCYSGIVREPLRGVTSVLPVERTLPHAVSGYRTLVANLRHLHDAAIGKVGAAPVDRAYSLPSIPMTLQGLADAMHRVVPREQHAKLGSIEDKIDPFLSRVVSTMAMKEMDHKRAVALGLEEVPTVDIVVREYMEDFASECIVTAEPLPKRART